MGEPMDRETAFPQILQRNSGGEYFTIQHMVGIKQSTKEDFVNLHYAGRDIWACTDIFVKMEWLM